MCDENGTDLGSYTHVRSTTRHAERSDPSAHRANSVSSRSATCLRITARLAPYGRASISYSALPNSLSSASSVSESSRGVSPRVNLLALDMTARTIDDLRIGKRRNVSHRSEVGDRSKNPAHDLTRAGLGHISDDPDVLRSRDLPDLPLNRL